MFTFVKICPSFIIFNLTPNDAFRDAYRGASSHDF